MIAEGLAFVGTRPHRSASRRESHQHGVIVRSRAACRGDALHAGLMLHGFLE